MYALILDNSQTTPNKSVYVWGAPIEMRRSITICKPQEFKGLVQRYCGQLEGVIITSERGLQAVESFGLKVRSDKVAYGHTYGCAGKIKIKTNVGDRRIRAVCVPTQLEMNSGGRTSRFMYHRWVQKLCAPERFIPVQPLVWEDGDDSAGMNIYKHLADPELKLIAIDLETTKEISCQNPYTGKRCSVGAYIDYAGYCFAFFNPESGWRYRTIVHPIRRMEHLVWLNAVSSSPAPKTFHNGCYDLAYLTRWGAKLRNYVHDTMYWMKSVCPFLSGFYNLSSTATFYLQESAYWKDGRQAKTVHEYMEYCARDCHNTAHIAVAQLSLTTKATFDNFASRFYTVPVTHTAEMRGALVDEEAHTKLRREYMRLAREAEEKVKAWTGYGPNQSAKLLPIFKGFELIARKLKTPDVQTITSTDVKNRSNLVLFHPLASALAEEIAKARRYDKWLSTYIDVPLWSASYNAGFGRSGRYYLFRLDPFGTESGRLSSSGSSFWAGGPGQNIPNAIRSVFKAPEGYAFGGSDAPQSETRTTAYCSRERRLVDVVEGVHDFHSYNASAFFGIPYDEIYDDVTGSKLNKDLRDLAKRVNHGANYNMGAFVLLTTIGVSNVRRAQKLLGLDASWSLMQVCAYLLKAFDSTYPNIRGRWYFEQVIKVMKTGRLPCVSGYKPLVLVSPTDSKMNLNSIVSLDPQNWSVVLSLRGANNLLTAELKGSPIKYWHQMHDENLVLVPTGQGITVEQVDKHFAECCGNSTELPWKWPDGSQAVLSIPVGESVFGTHWGDMKEDPVKRTPEILNKQIEEML